MPKPQLESCREDITRAIEAIERLSESGDFDWERFPMQAINEFLWAHVGDIAELLDKKRQSEQD